MRDRLAVLFLVTILSVPAAAAWAGKGHTEPSTTLDSTGGYMWPTPDVTSTLASPPVRKVYFNGFTTHSIGFHAEVASNLNPNYATIGSETHSWPGRAVAMLGVWKDCNKDGYIGLGDNVVLEYRAELLPDTSVCKVTPLPNPVPTTHMWIPPHNDGTWVREFIAIGPDLTRVTPPALPDGNPFNFMDNGARAWVDWNKPGTLPPTSRCYIFAPASADPDAHPEWGTYHSTGGVIEYVDCFNGFRVTDAWNGVAPDNTPAGTLSFRDRPRDQSNSSSRLNQANPYGDTRGASMVTAFDCSAPPLFSQRIQNTQYTIRISPPRVPTTNMGGTLGGTVNQTENSFEDCDRSSNVGNPHVNQLPYSGETAGIANTAGGKQQSDFILKFSEGQRANAIMQAAFGSGVSSDAGIRQHEVAGFYISTTVLGEDRNPFVDRDGLDPQPVTWMTYYASVTTQTTFGLMLNPANSVGIYGAQNCAGGIGPGKGEQNGWKCDPALWWPGGCQEGYSCGASIDGLANVDVSVRVGQTFQLRDADCYDHSIRALRPGVGYGLLTGTTCA